MLNHQDESARSLMLGMIRHVERSHRWAMDVFTPQPDQLRALSHFDPAGVIGALDSAELIAWARGLEVPVVNISEIYEHSAVPRVGVNDTAVGELAASHFIEMGFKNVTFVGAMHHLGSHLREAGFRKRLEPIVDRVQTFSLNSPAGFAVATASPPRELSTWLAQLPTPCAIFAYDDRCGRLIALACRALGIAMPQKIAILGCNDDEIICRLNTPPLSSVSLPLERVGYEAAIMLDRLMDGETAPKEPMLLPISSVASRQSTKTTPIPDSDVAAALRFIAAHEGEWIGVPEVLLAVPINRRSLERKFRQFIGRSPLEEIRRVRLEKAKQLLATTDLPMPMVASQSGFSEAKQLSLVFHDTVGVTPTTYRRQFRVPVEAKPARDGGAESAAPPI